ncbi:glycosyltransferase, partial [Acidithiobacillus sp. MC6.1]|nr:glycosyltransferase [Acidithiobacillus sp. MC6.1]
DGDGFGLDAFEFLPTDSISSPHQVTILVTAFNAAKTITSCLKSLLNQSGQNIQVIVIDDHSSDDTVSQINSIEDERMML